MHQQRLEQDGAPGVAQLEEFLAVFRLKRIMNSVRGPGRQRRGSACPVGVGFSALDTSLRRRRCHFQSRASACTCRHDRYSSAASDHAQMLPRARHDDVGLHRIRKTRAERARGIGCVQRGIRVYICPRQCPVRSWHPVDVAGAYCKSVDSFGRRKKTPIRLDISNRLQYRASALRVLCILEVTSGRKRPDGKLLGDIAGTDEEQNAELVGEPIKKPSPGRQLPLESSAHIPERNIDNNDVWSAGVAGTAHSHHGLVDQVDDKPVGRKSVGLP